MKTDAQLKKDVEAELDWEPAVNATHVGIEVNQGIVTLSGHLDSYPEKLAAIDAVQRVSDVQGVAVEVDVHLPGTHRRSDADIAQAANEALRWNTFVPPGRLKLKVEDGWITLTGEVDWAYQRAGAETAVHGLIGVKGVHNKIDIRRKASPVDIQRKIEAALQRAAHFDAQGIKVSAVDGKVTLEGKVHSLSERRLIENATWAAPGVSMVDDKIMIAPQR